MGRSNSFYGKTESQIVAGIAILLMIWHHLFTYQNWLIDEVNVSSPLGRYANYLSWLIGWLGNICIYIFAFQSGYSLLACSHLYDTSKKRFSRIISFLISYWLICIFFWIFGLLFNEPLPSLKNALLNMIGIEVGFYSKWINVTFAWYVLYYVLLITISPVLNKCFQFKKPAIITLTLISCICFLIMLSFCGIKEYWEPFMSSIAGMLTAKYKLFEYINQKRYLNKIWISMIMLIAILFIRSILLYTGTIYPNNPLFLVTESMGEGIIAFMFVFFFLSFIKGINSQRLSYLFCFFGSISMPLWFLHSILFTGSRFLQHYVYFAKDPILIYIITLLLFIPPSMIFNKLLKYLGKNLYPNTTQFKEIILLGYNKVRDYCKVSNNQ